jgi:virulence-associated protein VagC
MTSRRWLVERDELEAGEILLTPIPKPTDVILKKAVDIYDNYSENEDKKETFVSEIYNLKDYEIIMINDAINYQYDSFRLKDKSHAFDKPDKVQMGVYATTISNILNKTLFMPQYIFCTTYNSDTPLAIACVSFGGLKEEALESINENKLVDELLLQLDELLVEERSQSVFVKRNVRIYQKNEVYIIKPNQQKYWSYSSACRDADEVYADIMRTWRLHHE